MKKIILILGIIALIVAMSGCTNNTEQAQATETAKDDNLTIVEPVDITSTDNSPLADLGFDWLIEDKNGDLYVMYQADMLLLQEYNSRNNSKPFKVKYEVLGDEGAPYHKDTREILSVYDMDGKQL
jgi:ABC-type Fe3+-hydroxamate transport system substrate-binding protein